MDIENLVLTKSEIKQAVDDWADGNSEAGFLHAIKIAQIKKVLNNLAQPELKNSLVGQDGEQGTEVVSQTDKEQEDGR